MTRGYRMKILRFGMVGLVNTLVDYAILNLSVWTFGVVSPGGVVVCNLFSFLGANVNSYVMNKKWTFEDRSRWSKKEYTLFLLCSLGGLGINCSLIYWLSEMFAGLGWSFFINLNLAKLLATMASMVWNYFSYRAFVFGSCPTVGNLPADACEGQGVVPTSLRK